MIAQVVFDLPLEGPFDYSVPEELIAQVTIGRRVKVSFGARSQIGFVTGLLKESAIPRLKPVLSVCDASGVFNGPDLGFAREFSAYYGCSLGEALAAILRPQTEHKPCLRREHEPLISVIRCHPDRYVQEIQNIIDGYRRQYQDRGSDYCRFLILVPDVFRAGILSAGFEKDKSVIIGARSSVFESDGKYDCVLMVDDEDSSYRQEQTPKYDTRHVLLMRARLYGFDLVFIGISPSVELTALARADSRIKWLEGESSGLLRFKLVDLTNYKFIPGLISPPVRNALEAALKTARKSVLVLNRRGSYRMTRCVTCGGILKCSRCDSSMIYSRVEGKYLCRHCASTASGDTACPTCHKPSWKSQGIGVEQVQSELKKIFPQARVASFERSSSEKSSIEDFDILISTSAVLRFQGSLGVHFAAFIDFDAELNRLDTRSAFNAFSLALQVGSMAVDPILIQTRHMDHYVLKYLSLGNVNGFYDEELKIRKELGFSPFKHWIQICWRGKVEKKTLEAAQAAFLALKKTVPDNCMITPPLADAVGRKREQFRFNVMLQCDQVPQAMAYIKSTLTTIKRSRGIIMTLNIDP